MRAELLADYPEPVRRSLIEAKGATNGFVSESPSVPGEPVTTGDDSGYIATPGRLLACSNQSISRSSSSPSSSTSWMSR